MIREWVRTKAGALPFLLVGLGALILFGPMLLSGRVLFWGTPLLQFVPWREVALEALRQGHLPLWNPELGMGAPLLANYQLALFYPPNWLLGLVGIAWGQGMLVALHLAWAGCGAALLARRLGSSLLGQSMAGLAFGLSGYLVARGGFLTMNAAAAWLPWLVLCVDRLAAAVGERKTWREVGKLATWLALAFAMQWLAGHAQTAWYSLLLAGLWALWRAASSGSLRGLLRLLPWLLAAGALALLLASAQLIPTLEYMRLSHRSETLDPELALTYSFAPWRALGLLLPDLFGNPARGDFWGYGNYWEDAIYVGVIPLLFAALALFRGIAGRDAREGLIRTLAAASVVAFLFALGKNTPIFPWLFEHVPTFDLFQAPTRWNLIPVFSLAMLAAFGADAWRAPEGRSLYWTRLATVGAAVLALTAGLLGMLAPEIRLTFTRSFMLAGIGMLTFCLLALLRPPKLTLAWVALLGMVVGSDLLIAHWGLNPSTSPSLYEGSSELASQVGSTHRLYMPPDIEQELKFERTHRFDTFLAQIDWREVREMGLPNTTLLDGVPSANNFDPLLPERYAIWMQALDGVPLDRQQPLLALMDVGWRAETDAGSAHGVQYVPVDGASRARLIYQAIWVETPDQALGRVYDPGFDPEETLVLEGSGEGEGGISGRGEIRQFEQIDAGHVSMQVTSSENGWLLLSDAWYPGWRATIDGVETEILHGDYLFRAVRVPAGEHRVVFEYEPLSMKVGILMTAVGLLALGAMLWLCRRD